jgi:two-component system OmpR family sensor kinase
MNKDRRHWHEQRARYRAEWHAERELWRRSRSARPWWPWWLQARMRRRIVSWLGVALVAGMVIGWQLRGGVMPWWQLAITVVVLGAMASAIAWQLTHPLLLVVRAARDIGDGKLDTRIDVRHHGGEVRVLAAAINEMAAKIQQQLVDQRQLLAAVSHELRTPLGHMRVLIETARDAKDAAALAELEREVLVLDELVGKLLASSRLEFGNLDRREVDLGVLIADVATSCGVSTEAIEAIGTTRASVDATLVRRALANLLDNARVHAGGAVAVRVERRAGLVAIEVDDAGPGIPSERRADAFRAFVPSTGGGLGLGLALVSRIAVAHGGGAWIADRPGGGARVGFSIAAGA